MGSSIRRCILMGITIGGFLCGCTPEQYAEQADRAAYRTLDQGQQTALGSERSFSASYRPYCPEGPERQESIRINDSLVVPLGDTAPVTLTLDDCLQIAFRNSRSLQTRKEELYLAALALANERRSWNYPLLAGFTESQAEAVRVGNSSGADSDTASGAANLNLTQRFVQGGVLTMAATVDFATDFLGSETTPVGSLLEANFTQPLLRGAWRGLAYENQYRRERDFLLAVYDYERFTETFAVDILTEFYRVLQQRDRLENEKTNIQRLEDTVTVTSVLVEGGYVSRVEADQAEQDLINAQIRYQQELQAHEDALDAYKIRLGLPISAQVRLNYPDALSELVEQGPRPIYLGPEYGRPLLARTRRALSAVREFWRTGEDVGSRVIVWAIDRLLGATRRLDPPPRVEQAIDLALKTRPDVLTRRAGLRDARRDVVIAADNFLPQLDVVFDVSAPSTPVQEFARIQFHRHTRAAGVILDYDLDQTDNRDAYRAAIISRARTLREYALFVDQVVRLGVRGSYRNLVQTRTNYQLQRRNVVLAERRRALAIMEQRAGRANARDVLEAEEALRNAQNGLTATLISYTTTRLDFLANLGMTRVDREGVIHERQEPFKFERIARRYPYLGETVGLVCYPTEQPER